MLSNDLNYLNVTYTVEIHSTWEFKSCNFQNIFLNRIFSVIYDGLVRMRLLLGIDGNK